MTNYKSRNETDVATIDHSNFIVTRDASGEDRVFAGCVNGKRTWTLQPEKQLGMSAALACDLLRDFHNDDHGDGPRVVVGHPILGVRVIQGGRENGHRIFVM